MELAVYACPLGAAERQTVTKIELERLRPLLAPLTAGQTLELLRELAGAKSLTDAPEAAATS